MGLVAVLRPLLAFAFCAGLATLTHADFSPGCAFPYDGVKKHHPIDTKCPKHEGNATGALRKTANRLKNDFCATGTSVTVDVTFEKSKRG